MCVDLGKLALGSICEECSNCRGGEGVVRRIYALLGNMRRCMVYFVVCSMFKFQLVVL